MGASPPDISADWPLRVSGAINRRRRQARVGRGEGEIGDVERDKHGASKRSSPADQEQRPIARAVERRWQRVARFGRAPGGERLPLAGVGGVRRRGRRGGGDAARVLELGEEPGERGEQGRERGEQGRAREQASARGANERTVAP